MLYVLIIYYICRNENKIMGNLEIFKTETKLGILEFKGVPVLNDFDFRSFASDNGFFNVEIDSTDNSDKYGGVGFFVAKNFSDDSDMSYHLKKRLEVLFINSQPVIYKIY